MSPWNNQQLDRELPQRVTRASLVFTAALFLFLLSWRLQGYAFSYLLGAGLGIYSFEVFRVGVRAFLRTPGLQSGEPEPLWSKVAICVLFGLKLPIWLVTIYAAVIDPTLSLFVFVGGIATPQFVMVSKVVSQMCVGSKVDEQNKEDSVDLSFHQNTGSVAQ